MKSSINNTAFWICGKHTVNEALKNSRRKIIKIAILKKIEHQFDQSLLENKKINYENETFFSKNFGQDISHQGIAAYINPINTENIKTLISINNVKKIIALDGIKDPRNIGAIIRSAVSYNWSTLLVNKKDFNQNSASLFKAASGAMEHIKLVTCSNIYNELKFLKKENFWILGLSSNSNNNLYNCEDLEKKVLVFGSEDKGIKPYLEKFCDMTYKIPMSNKVSSLNVSCAVSSALTFFDFKKKTR